MKKRVFIIHGWEGYPEEGWFPWLRSELEKRGFEVFVPQLPEADRPRIQNWIPAIASVVGNANEDTYFVGHSMGCQAIARYLETLSSEIKVGGAVFVAGFFKRLTGNADWDLEASENKTTIDHWLRTPIDFKKIRDCLSKSVAIFSDNDSWVPLDNQDDFRDRLGSEIIIEHNKRHFSGSDGTRELPSVFRAVLKVAQLF